LSFLLSLILVPEFPLHWVKTVSEVLLVVLVALHLVGSPHRTHWAEVDNMLLQRHIVARGLGVEILVMFPGLQGEQKLFQCSAKLVHYKG
jgi:hypothetical protein